MSETSIIEPDAAFRSKLDVLRLAFVMRKPEARIKAQAIHDVLMRVLGDAGSHRILRLGLAADMRADAALLSEYPDSAATVAGLIQEALCLERSALGSAGESEPPRVALARVRLAAVHELLAEFHKANLRRPVDLTNWTEDGPGRAVVAYATDEGPTPEAWAQSMRASRIAPIPELFANGHIDRRHVAAAREIQWVVEGVTAKLDARAGGYNPSGGTRPSWSNDVPAQVDEIHGKCYVPWTRDMLALQRSGRRHLELTLCVTVGGASLLAARRRFRLGYETAVGLIRDGLKDYWDRIRERRRKEDAAKRANTHAASS